MTALVVFQVLLYGCHGWLVHPCSPHCCTQRVPGQQWHPTLYFGAQPAAEDVGLLPPDGFLQTWTKAKKARVFTAADLYGHIDGGAEIFLEFGFAQLTVQAYAEKNPPAGKPAAEITLEIYRMSDAAAALGIYLLNRGKEPRDERFAERHCLHKYQLIFQRDRYYVVINNPSGKDSHRSAMLDFARHVAARLPKDNIKNPGDKLPPEGLDPASLRLARGQFGLQSIFTLGKGNILQLGRQATAVAGNYGESAGGHTLLLVDYPSEDAAQKAFQNLKANLDECLTVSRAAENRLQFKDNRDKYGLVELDGKRLAIKLRLAAPP